MSRPRALLVDFGGVLTTNVFEAFSAFCTTSGLPADAVGRAFRDDAAKGRLLARLETGEMSEVEFERDFAVLLGADAGIEIESEGLIARMTSTLEPEPAMLEVAERIRDAGHTTAIVSNSLGYDAYDGYDLEERFDHVVISGRVGVRKPSRRIYLMAAEIAGVAPEECVFVDDFEHNVVAAQRVGMHAVHHRDPDETVPLLEELFQLDAVVR